MACLCSKPCLNAYNSAAQIITTNGALAFDTNLLQIGEAIQHVAGANTVNIISPGIYQVSVDADATVNTAGTTAVPISLQLSNNSVAMPQAIATFSALDDVTGHLHIDALVKVGPSCCVVSNNAAMQVIATGSATINNANILVAKI